MKNIIDMSSVLDTMKEFSKGVMSASDASDALAFAVKNFGVSVEHLTDVLKDTDYRKLRNSLRVHLPFELVVDRAFNPEIENDFKEIGYNRVVTKGSGWLIDGDYVCHYAVLVGKDSFLLMMCPSMAEDRRIKEVLTEYLI